MQLDKGLGVYLINFILIIYSLRPQKKTYLSNDVEPLYVTNIEEKGI